MDEDKFYLNFLPYTNQYLYKTHKKIEIFIYKDFIENADIIIEKNYLHDSGEDLWECISISNSWGDSKGVTIRNNIIDTIAIIPDIIHISYPGTALSPPSPSTSTITLNIPLQYRPYAS